MGGLDPSSILQAAMIDPAVYGDAGASVDGRALFRLVKAIQTRLDDYYIGFLSEPLRLALEEERTRAHIHCATFGEALRVSIRFTQALSADIGPRLVEEDDGPGLRHICTYRTRDGVDRDIFVWFRFVWIYHFFSWLIGRPLKLRAIHVRGARPVQANGFDRFALFGCPITFNAPLDALSYDRSDLNFRLVHRTLTEFLDHEATEPDWFARPGDAPTWRNRTEQTLTRLQRQGEWSPSVEQVAARLSSRARRLRRELAHEGESFQQIRTRLRGELAGAYLLATDMAVTLVGYRVGFSEPGSFTRNFSDWAGVTPSHYRRLYKADRARIAAATTLLTERTCP